MCLMASTAWTPGHFGPLFSSTPIRPLRRPRARLFVPPDLVSYQTTSDVDEVASRVNSRIVSKGVSAMWESSGSSVTYV